MKYKTLYTDGISTLPEKTPIFLYNFDSCHAASGAFYFLGGEWILC
jgi:hypothetical protein